MLLQSWVRFNRRSPAPRIHVQGLITLSASLLLSGCGAGTTTSAPLAIPSSTSSTTPSGPTLGYVFSTADGSLRALLGVRGSARMSASIVPTGVYVAGEASINNSSALLEDGNGSLFALSLPSAQPIHVADNLPANAHIVFSPSGQTAVVYSPGSSAIARVTAIPATPQVQVITAGNQILSAAISDAGEIVTATSGSPMVVGTLSTAGQFSRLTTTSGTPGLSFIAGSDDLLLTDSGANTLALIHGVSTNPSLQALAATGLNKPVAVAASRDRSWAAVVNSGDSSVVRVDLAHGAPAARLACDCKASELSSLAGNGVFRVNALGTGPVWTIDLAGTVPQLLFVPAIGKVTQ